MNNTNLVDTTYLFRQAADSDVSLLVHLNNKWQFKNLNDLSVSQNGFLSAQFDADDFKILIDKKEVVVSEYEGRIIGYYLLNNYCETKKFHEAKKIISTLIESRKINRTVKIGIGAQALIDTGHQGKGLSRPMLKLLCEIVGTQYDYLYSSISKNNMKAYQVHTKEGWFVIDENENNYYVLLDPKTVI